MRLNGRPQQRGAREIGSRGYSPAPHAPADAAQQGKSMPLQCLGAALAAGGSEWARNAHVQG